MLRVDILIHIYTLLQTQRGALYLKAVLNLLYNRSSKSMMAAQNRAETCCL